MLLKLTSAGKALLDANPTTLVVTRVDLGSSYNYNLPTDPTGLTGSVVFTSNAAVYPEVADANTVTYTVFLGKTVGPFNFGELAMYVGSTLFGVAVSATLMAKTATSGSVEGGEIKLDFFCDLQAGQRFNTVDATPNNQLVLPSIPVPDLLVPPALNDKNMYIVYSSENDQQPYLAYADPTGKWSFSSKPATKFTGTVDSAGQQGIESLDITGSYTGAAGDLIIQFIDGPQRGYCRQLTSKSAGTIVWSTPMAQLPDEGDAFAIYGPLTGGSSGGSGGPQISVSGSLGVGNELTATLLNGVATGFQWYRDGSPISGATDIQGSIVSQYTQVNADALAELSIRAIGFQPETVVGTVPGSSPTPTPTPSPSDTRPRFGLGAANAYSASPQALLDSMTALTGSANNGSAGTFSLQTTSGNYGWLAVVASASSSGVHVFDGVGFGGWSGAGLGGNNGGASPDPTISSTLFTDGNGTQWRLFRQDYVHANPSAATYTLSAV